MAGLMSARGGSRSCWSRSLLRAQGSRWLRRKNMLLLLTGLATLCLLQMVKKTASWNNEQDSREWNSGDGVGVEYMVPCLMANISCSSKLPPHASCSFCEYSLRKLTDSNMSAFNLTRQITAGASNTFIYRIVAPHTAAGEHKHQGLPTDTLAKVSCLPFFKHRYITMYLVPGFLTPLLKKYERGQVHKDWFHLPCKTRFTGNLNDRDVAMWKLANKCKLGHLMEEVQIGRIRGKMPEAAYDIDSEALFMKEVKGLSLRYFLEMMNNSQLVEDYFVHRLNSSQVIEAAVFDLFTRQGDRHYENVYVDETGNMKLIDSNKCMGDALDSIFLPSTRLHTASQTGVINKRTKSIRRAIRTPSLVSRMDYRCHSEGPIGTNYPPGLLDCMRNISSSSLEDIMKELQFNDKTLARNLKQSGQDMLSMGFEWTLYKGGPKRDGGGGYFPQLPCCKIYPNNKNAHSSGQWFKCEESWKPTEIHKPFQYDGQFFEG